MTKPNNLIRVAAAVPWPNDHTTFRHHHPAADKVAKPKTAGDVIFGLGKPTEPSPKWICGTDLVWPVYEINSAPIEPFDGMMPYVCRHQILAGD